MKKGKVTVPVIDVSSCIGCGLCADICPEVFRLGKGDVAEVHISGTVEPRKLKEAVESCPVSCISLVVRDKD